MPCSQIGRHDNWTPSSSSYRFLNHLQTVEMLPDESSLLCQKLAKNHEEMEYFKE